MAPDLQPLWVNQRGSVGEARCFWNAEKLTGLEKIPDLNLHPLWSVLHYFRTGEGDDGI
ncbi:MAG: hypothetical protein AB1861_20435 [Cyanobacteriota bacterium]